MYRLVAILVVIAAIFGGGFYSGHRWEENAFLKFKAEVVAAQAAATEAARAEQVRLDADALAAAQDYGAAQAREAARSSSLYEQVKHAPVPSRACIPWGLVRLHDAAALGADTDALAFPPRVTADACSPVGWRDLAQRIVANYGAARANAIQLDALIGAWKKQDAEHHR
jgi:hypothetical protein